MLSTVLPPIREWAPQALFPIIPPKVQYLWVAGSGANVIHILRKVDHDRNVAALSCETRSAAAAEDRHLEFPTGCNSSHHVIGISWNNNSHRDLAVDREIGRIKRAACGIEAHLAL